ncbi:MAG TPA: alpha/beta fold hydrolase, partial [Myxococcota bacterium]|nr:alpha/beta fold hydrolase [Myxococcota bacterium]
MGDSGSSSLRSVPVRLAQTLSLESPVFMGCSVGGLLALDLALHHPEAFRAVISLEGALQAPGSTESLQAFWHPRVSSEYKARLMNGLMSPTSPEAPRLRDRSRHRRPSPRRRPRGR